MRRLLANFFTLGVKVIVVFVALSLSFFIFYWCNNRLFLFEARMIWPENNFSEQSFKGESSTGRASMAADLIEKQAYIGMECKKIPELLGDSTGDYYYQDSNYTYRLTDNESANWILTFVCDENGTIAKVFIRKSCCSISKRILLFGLDLIDPLFKGSKR